MTVYLSKLLKSQFSIIFVFIYYFLIIMIIDHAVSYKYIIIYNSSLYKYFQIGTLKWSFVISNLKNLKFLRFLSV